MVTTDPQDAVRRYLQYLADPESLVDKAAVAKLEKAVAAAKDPLDRLHAIGALRRAASVDVSDIEDGFARGAAAYARAQDLDRADFASLGVSEYVLAEAFGGARRPGAAGRPARGTGRKASGNARGGVEAVKEAVFAGGAEFKLAELQVASPITVRKAVDELIESGQVERLGPDPHHNSRGRAPIVYRVVRR
jgi:hypothetical protein